MIRVTGKQPRLEDHRKRLLIIDSMTVSNALQTRVTIKGADQKYGRVDLSYDVKCGYTALIPSVHPKPPHPHPHPPGMHRRARRTTPASGSGRTELWCMLSAHTSHPH